MLRIAGGAAPRLPAREGPWVWGGVGGVRVQRKFDEAYGPTVRRFRAPIPPRARTAPPTPPQPHPRPPPPPQWHCVVGADFKASFSHESKTFIFLSVGKTNVLLYKT
jgi:Dynein light chain type 1